MRSTRTLLAFLLALLSVSHSFSLLGYRYRPDRHAKSAQVACRRTQNQRQCSATPSASGGIETDDNDEELYETPSWMLDEVPTLEGDDDIETIERLRIERIKSKDRWQSYLFRDNQAGEWIGNYEVYQPEASPMGAQLMGAGMGQVRTSITAGEATNEGVNITIREDYDIRSGRSDLKPVAESLDFDRFRTTTGNQVVGDTYTIGAVNDSTDGKARRYVMELGVREDAVRTRCRFEYSTEDNGCVPQGAGYVYFLHAFTIIRECLKDAGPSEAALILDPQPGPGIYDPQVAGGEPYVQLDLRGRLSVLFPLALQDTKELQVVTMEFEGKDYRWQVDRKMESIDGAVKSIELTEIRSEDAKVYPAQHNRNEILR